MVIRPLTAAYTMGEFGRPAHSLGGKGGPAAFLAGAKDFVSLGGKTAAAGLYSGKPFFKIMGAVELMSDDVGMFDAGSVFGDNPVLI